MSWYWCWSAEIYFQISFLAFWYRRCNGYNIIGLTCMQNPEMQQNTSVLKQIVGSFCSFFKTHFIPNIMDFPCNLECPILHAIEVYTSLYNRGRYSAKVSAMPPVIKSPRYTGGDFMFLYRFVRRRRRRRRRSRRRPQILVHAITFERLFGFLSFLARLLALTYRLTD